MGLTNKKKLNACAANFFLHWNRKAHEIRSSITGSEHRARKKSGTATGAVQE